MSEVELINCWDAVVNGTAGEKELDNILSILDFPIESFEGDEEFVGDWDSTKSEFLGPIPSDVITIGQPVIDRTKIHTEPPVLPPPPIAPIEDTPASFIPQQNKSTEVKEQGVFQTQSPVSVLESIRSSSSAKIPLIKSHIAKRARSKRARRPSHSSPWLLIPPLFATCPLSTKTHNNNSQKTPRGRKRKSSLTPVSPHMLESSSQKAILQFHGSENTELQSSPSQSPAPKVKGILQFQGSENTELQSSASQSPAPKVKAVLQFHSSENTELQSSPSQSPAPKVKGILQFQGSEHTELQSSASQSPAPKVKAVLQFQGSEHTELQSSASQSPALRVSAVRKCSHCEITKTPQWRLGPMGPNTLCNACGVRFRSGRLFPEYRPLKSPTFVPTVHSNSHRKVIEMRTKGQASSIEGNQMEIVHIS